MSEAYFIGIDIGTQGARVVLLDEVGQQLAAKEEVFPLNERSREEQSPDIWWDCCCRLIPELVKEVQDKIPLDKIRAVAVTSTSGTIIPLDRNFNPLHPAIMYSDPRSGKQAAFCAAIALKEIKEGYTAFNASSGLPKMRWFLDQYPDRAAQLYKFIHAADFITGRLCGEYGVTDYTNAMKSGYDIHQYKWQEYIVKQIGIRKEWLQEVRPSGVPLGTIKTDLTTQWGLPEGIIVTTGMTDGCASQVASGAVSPGQWNTTIGTTLVIKGVTGQAVADPSGVIYNHRHPTGYWMPGGASNTGADWVSKLFAGQDLQQLSEQAATKLPAASLAWPLIQQGERFPFKAPQAVGFWPEGDLVEKFTACMEGVAFIERYAYERIASLSGEKIERIFSAGGGSNSDTWLRIRSAVINVSVCKMKNVSGAAGAAILAASRSFYSSLQDAAAAMVSPELTVQPSPPLVNAYDLKYKLFIDELKARKILN
ncbi:carbohydrate kinase [Paraflavitalea soli]|uniref:Carbohydrate kinase n=1 Tax=Paraflavitalea soli TaxID=2315862 RepID=A0A3B7MRT4_9BACT|nr:FGGY-family carbohydrate kinase [Paraflavitalea soli]AXY76868.1 carbohydrate kinase [Paraflavitalea soli]